jgi:hypothetical protein
MPWRFIFKETEGRAFARWSEFKKVKTRNPETDSTTWNNVVEQLRISFVYKSIAYRIPGRPNAPHEQPFNAQGQQCYPWQHELPNQ